MSDAPGRRVVIVGASAAGLRCAARLARLEPDWRVTVFERAGTFSYAACGLPYVLAGEIDDVDALRRTADGTLRDERYFEAVKGIEVRAGTEVTAVEPRRRIIRVRAAGGPSEEVPYDDLVLAVGARPRRLRGQPVHARVRSFHTADDLRPLLPQLTRGALRRVAVVGAGLLGCELADAFRSLWGLEVTLLEAAEEPLAGLLDAEMGGVVAQELRRNGVRLVAGLPALAVEVRGEGVRITAGSLQVEADLAVVAAGVQPETGLARAAGVAVGRTGGIAVSERLATSVAGIWAAGDCVEVTDAITGSPVYAPLGSLANRQGRTLANVLAGRDGRFPPVVKAAAAKVFACNVAAAGLTREAAAARGITARSAWVSTHDRAHYLPDAQEIVINLVYSPTDRRVLGVQVVGEGDVTKRVDVAVQLLARRATVEDFAAIEHAYAPSYAPAVEPLAVAAWAAEDCEDGVAPCSPVVCLHGRRILDVRTRDEVAARPIDEANAVHIPLDELHRSWHGDGGDRWLVICERGARSAEAVRWLRARGAAAEYLGGGLRLHALNGGGQAS